MSTWTQEQLGRLEHDEEVVVVTARADGSPRTGVPVWVVRVGDAVYLRSWKGDRGAWYRAALRDGTGAIRLDGSEIPVSFTPAPKVPRDQVDAAYERKYARYAAYLLPMIADEAAATTLRIDPR